MSHTGSIFKRFGETALPKRRVGRLSDDWRKRIKRWSIRHFIPAAVWFNWFVPSENTEQRKLAAIMFTDMVGYSTLAQRDDKREFAKAATISKANSRNFFVELNQVFCISLGQKII